MLLADLNKVLEERPRKAAIAKAIRNELRIRMHLELAMTQAEASSAVTMHLDEVKARIPADRYAGYLSVFQFPVDTNLICGEISEAWKKLFDAQDSSFYYEFTSPDLRDDWDEYRTEELDEPEFWSEDVYSEMLGYFNSVLAVDLPRVQEGPRPEPYYLLIRITDVIHYEMERDGKLTQLVYWEGKRDKIHVLEPDQYQVFLPVEPGQYQAKLEEFTSAHDLGRCPARWVWDKYMDRSQPDVKESPFMRIISKLDWWLFAYTSKKYGDLSNAWPMLWVYAASCDYRQDNYYCDGGFIRDPQNQYIVLKSGKLKPCPKCSGKRQAGVGAIIDVEPPSEENEWTKYAPPAGVIEVNPENLKYNISEIERLKAEIIEAATGTGIESVNNQAINELQVQSLFESRRDTILRMKAPFERAWKWGNEIAAELRYGNLFVGCAIDLGREHYLITAGDLYGMYLAIREKEGEYGTLEMLFNKYLNTQFREDPVQLYRQQLLGELEPFKHRKVSTVGAMAANNTVSKSEFILKYRFGDLIARFERENGSLTEFGTAITRDKRVKAILEALYAYIEEFPQPEPPPAPVQWAPNQ